jgi:hypothetical protein
MRWPDLINTLAWWQWGLLALVPPAIVLLYFLKLKRRPVEVPSTYLWLRSIEDLHVNTIWQRLRRNLLLFLQLLLLAIVMGALVRPGWEGTKLEGNRFIFLIDNSASMQATDVAPSRLEEAKRQARELIDGMRSGDVAMVVSFADTARIEQMFTDNRRELRRALDGIQPTERGTSLAEALRVAAGLANPGRSSPDKTDVQVAEPLPATLYIFSDGRFEDVTNFSLGNLEPKYQPIGRADAANVGVVMLNVGKHETRANQYQAFARLQNFSDKAKSVTLELSKQTPDAAGAMGREEMINADKVELGPNESKGVALDLGEMESGVIRLRAETGDQLAVDDQAWAVVNPPRRAKVLAITAGDDALRFALATEGAQEIAEVTFETPDYLEKEAYQQQAAGGKFDLVIYDRCQPKRMPQANTLFFGRTPPEGWSVRAKAGVPQIIDADPTHPIMQYIDLGDVLLAEGTPLEPPPGGKVLIDSQVGPMFALAPREGFEDAVLGFVLVDEVRAKDGSVERYIGSNWPIRPSFPVFVFNALSYLGGSRTVLGASTVRPGQPVTLETAASNKTPSVRLPDGEVVKLTEGRLGRFTFTKTGQLGVYGLLGDKAPQHFAVNLFLPSESDIRPQTAIKVGNVTVSGQKGSIFSRREVWKLLLLGGLGVLLLEWYIYNRRVYV